MCQTDPWENAGAISRPVVQGLGRTVNLPSIFLEKRVSSKSQNPHTSILQRSGTFAKFLNKGFGTLAEQFGHVQRRQWVMLRMKWWGSRN